MTELSLAKLNNPCNHVVEPGVNGCRTQSTKTNNMKKVALFSLVSALMLVVGFNAAAAAKAPKAPKAPKAFKIKAATGAPVTRVLSQEVRIRGRNY